MTESLPRPFSIRHATIDPRRGVVAVDGHETRLEPRVMKVLLHLAAVPGEVVTRSELIDQAWPGGHASDEALTKAISQLRRALKDRNPRNRVIETVPKIGYRLVPPPTDLPTTLRPKRGVRSHRVRIGAWAVAATTALLVAAGSASLLAEWGIGSDSTPLHQPAQTRIVRLDGGNPAAQPVSLDDLGLTEDALRGARALTVKRICTGEVSECGDVGAASTLTVVDPGRDPSLTRALVHEMVNGSSPEPSLNSVRE